MTEELLYPTLQFLFTISEAFCSTTITIKSGTGFPKPSVEAILRCAECKPDVVLFF